MGIYDTTNMRQTLCTVSQNISPQTLSEGCASCHAALSVSPTARSHVHTKFAGHQSNQLRLSYPGRYADLLTQHPHCLFCSQPDISQIRSSRTYTRQRPLRNRRLRPVNSFWVKPQRRYSLASTLGLRCRRHRPHTLRRRARRFQHRQ